MGFKRILSDFTIFSARIFSLLLSVVLVLVAIGIIYFSYSSIKTYIELGNDGILADARVTYYEYSERITRRKSRTRKVIIHSHTISYEGHVSKINLDRKYSIGTVMKILYSKSKPENFILSQDKPSFTNLIFREVGIFYIIIVPLLVLGIAVWAWERFHIFLDPLGEKLIGLKLRFPMSEQSIYRQKLTNETDQVTIKDSDPRFMLVLAIICAYSSSEKETLTKSRYSGQILDLAIFEIGVYVFFRLSKKSELITRNQEFQILLDNFIHMSCEILKVQYDSILKLISQRFTGYLSIDQSEKDNISMVTLTWLIAESTKLQTPTPMTEFSLTQSFGIAPISKEVIQWFAKCIPLIDNLDLNKIITSQSSI